MLMRYFWETHHAENRTAVSKRFKTISQGNHVSHLPAWGRGIKHEYTNKQQQGVRLLVRFDGIFLGTSPPSATPTIWIFHPQNVGSTAAIQWLRVAKIEGVLQEFAASTGRQWILGLPWPSEDFYLCRYR